MMMTFVMSDDDDDDDDDKADRQTVTLEGGKGGIFGLYVDFSPTVLILFFSNVFYVYIFVIVIAVVITVIVITVLVINIATNVVDINDSLLPSIL